MKDNITDLSKSSESALNDFAVQRRHFLSTAGKLFAVGGLGLPLLSLLESPALADQSSDIQILQTSVSIANLAAATYSTVLGLDVIGGANANAFTKRFIQTARDHHIEHAKAINSAVQNLGGRQQTAPNAVLLDVVNKAKPALTTFGSVVDLLVQLENASSQTYVASIPLIENSNARSLIVSIMGVSAQHLAGLKVFQALVVANLSDLIASPPDVTRFPAAALVAGFENTVYKTDQARPSDEGALK